MSGGLDQRSRDQVPGRFTGALSINDVATPLQADFAGHRLTRTLAYAGDLDIERIKREQWPAFLGRGKERREKSILVGDADQRLAMTIIVVHRRKLPEHRVQSTAISAAPTLRRSPNRML